MTVENSTDTAIYVQHHLQHNLLNLHNFTATSNGFWTLNLDTLSVSIILGLIFFNTISSSSQKRSRRCARQSPEFRGNPD